MNEKKFVIITSREGDLAEPITCHICTESENNLFRHRNIHIGGIAKSSENGDYGVIYTFVLRVL